MLQKIRELFKKYKEERGQGVVEYALVLGFVAIIAVYLIGNSQLKEEVVDKGIKNAKDAASVMDSAYSSAKQAPTTTTSQ